MFVTYQFHSFSVMEKNYFGGSYMFNIDQETQEKIMEMVRSHLDEILTNTLNDKKRVNAIT